MTQIKYIFNPVQIFVYYISFPFIGFSDIISNFNNFFIISTSEIPVKLNLILNQSLAFARAIPPGAPILAKNPKIITGTSPYLF